MGSANPFFPENCEKEKKLARVDVPWAPPDPPLKTILSWKIYMYKFNQIIKKLLLTHEVN